MQGARPIRTCDPLLPKQLRYQALRVLYPSAARRRWLTGAASNRRV